MRTAPFKLIPDTENLPTGVDYRDTISDGEAYQGSIADTKEVAEQIEGIRNFCREIRERLDKKKLNHK